MPIALKKVLTVRFGKRRFRILAVVAQRAFWYAHFVDHGL